MNDFEMLIRFRDGELSSEEGARLERRLREEPELADRWDRLRGSAEALKDGAAESFGPFFSARVMARIRNEEGPASESLYEALAWAFPRLAAACLVLALAISVYSVLGGGYGGTIVEAVLGLPEATLETALALGG